MYTLAFDTTANGVSILLSKDGRMIDLFQEEMDFGQAEVLIPEIRNTLETENIQFQDLDLAVVCTGPGSFTGVRSSISAARAFGLACPKTKIIGVSAFEAYVHGLQPDELATINAVIIETKRDDFYYQLFDEKRKKITEPSAGNYDEIINQLRGPKITLVGDGVERFLNKPSGLSLHVIKMLNCPPIEDLAACGIYKYQNKIFDFPKPLYLRAPDVCIK